MVVFRVSLAAMLLLLAGLAHPQDAAKLSRDAYFAIDADPFNSAVLSAATRDINRAHQLKPDHPWVLIAVSRVMLERGYRKGSRARLSSYAADAVKAAGEYARRAVDADPKECMAHVQLARTQIITEDHRGAWESLNRAHLLDRENFYPWYYRGVVSLQMRDTKRASEAFDAALQRAKLPYQRAWTLDARINIAEALRDVKAEEQAHRQLIEASPGDAHVVGNFGNFLKQQKRYDEAIEQYRKAIAINPYPIVEEQLKQTLLLRDARK